MTMRSCSLWFRFLTFLFIVSTSLSSPDAYAELADKLEQLSKTAPQLDANGFFNTNLGVSKNGKYYKADLRGKQKSNVYVHNMEQDKHLKDFACDKDTVTLQYKNPMGAQSARAKMTKALKGGAKKSLLTGRYLFSCPPAMPPIETRTTKDGEVSNKGYRQTMRRITSVSSLPGKPDCVKVHTTYAFLDEAFSDLEFHGTTNMITKKYDMKKDIEKQVRESMIEDMYMVKVKRTSDMNSEPRVSDDKCCKRLRNLGNKIKTGLQNLWSKIKGTLKPIVGEILQPFKLCRPGNGFSTCVKSIFSAVSSIVTIIPRTLGALLPPLVNIQRTVNLGRVFSINYNPTTKRADQMFIAQTPSGVFLKTPPVKDIPAVYIAGKFACYNCFARIYNGKLTWGLKIGGGTTARLNYIVDVDYELAMEVGGSLTIVKAYSFDQLPTKVIPLPYLSVPIGPPSLGIYLGFAVLLELSYGFSVSGSFYWNYHLAGHIQAGFSAEYLAFGPRVIGSHQNHKQTAVGPILKSGTVSLYVLPLIGIEFTHVAAVEFGVQPTISFQGLGPSGSCKVRIRTTFSLPLIVFAWIGIRFPGIPVGKKTVGEIDWRLLSYTKNLFMLAKIPLNDATCIPASVVDPILKNWGISANMIGDVSKDIDKVIEMKSHKQLMVWSVVSTVVAALICLFGKLVRDVWVEKRNSLLEKKSQVEVSDYGTTMA